MLTADLVKTRALELGFDLCGIAPVDAFVELNALPGWLARGFGGRMTYLNRTARKRADVRRWLPSARSVVSVACLYHTDRPYAVERVDPGRADLARYAWGDDYHDVMGPRLQALMDWMGASSEPAFEARWCVDDGPVQERVYAMHAGLGWIGKHTCLINHDFGSWFLLGEIATNLALEPDQPAFDRCGSCTLCLEACPTGAIVEPYVLDATRCVSYLTIEVRGAIPPQQHRGVGLRVFGCDICQEVCPYNATAPVSARPEWQPRPALDGVGLDELAALDDAQLEAVIAGTALRRAGVTGLRRNLAIARRNAGRGAE